MPPLPEPDPPGSPSSERSRSAPQGGAPVRSEDMLPLVYAELRRIAAARMAQLPPGNTLQPTALVHEAYLRLAGGGDSVWNSRAHFVSAAVQSMRQVLVDQVRRKKSAKRGGDRVRVDLEKVPLAIGPPNVDLLDFHAALTRLEAEDERKARIVLLRCMGGLERQEIADVMGISRRTVDRDWRFIRAWLRRELGAGSTG